MSGLTVSLRKAILTLKGKFSVSQCFTEILPPPRSKIVPLNDFIRQIIVMTWDKIWIFINFYHSFFVGVNNESIHWHQLFRFWLFEQHVPFSMFLHHVRFLFMFPFFISFSVVPYPKSLQHFASTQPSKCFFSHCISISHSSTYFIYFRLTWTLLQNFVLNC